MRPLIWNFNPLWFHNNAYLTIHHFTKRFIPFCLLAELVFCCFYGSLADLPLSTEFFPFFLCFIKLRICVFYSSCWNFGKEIKAKEMKHNREQRKKRNGWKINYWKHPQYWEINAEEGKILTERPFENTMCK